MAIQVEGANWDLVVLRALADNPPPDLSDEERHMHVLRLLLDAVGEDVKVFLRCHGSKYALRWNHSSDPFLAMISWTADYFLHLYEFTQVGQRAIPSWSDAVREASTLGETTRLVLSMQLGYCLLLPMLVEEATGRPAYPVVHDHNPAVLQIYRKRLLLGRPLILTELGPSDIRQWIKSDGIVIANIDTTYPGTRRILTLPFLGGRLTVPVGLLSLALRRSFDVRAMAAPGSYGCVELKVSQPLTGDLEGSLREFGSYFERWVTAYAEQWMAWGSLIELS
jgi:hypothetical protein